MSAITAAKLESVDVKNHVSLSNVVRDSLTMAHRGLLRIKRTPEQLMDVTVFPVIFTAMFTYLFGGAISGSVDQYLPLIIPGILVQSIVTASVTTGIQLREDLDKGVTDRFRSLPIARIAPLSGALLTDMFRYALGAAITISVGLLIGFRPAGGLVGIALGCLLVVFCATAVSWIFAFLGVIARSAQALQGLSFVVLFPLTFMSNAFVPTTNMPDWVRFIVEINPISHIVTATRELFNAQPPTGSLAWALLLSLGITVVFAPLAVRAYMRKA